MASDTACSISFIRMSLFSVLVPSDAAASLATSASLTVSNVAFSTDANAFEVFFKIVDSSNDSPITTLAALVSTELPIASIALADSAAFNPSSSADLHVFTTSEAMSCVAANVDVVASEAGFGAVAIADPACCSVELAEVASVVFGFVALGFCGYGGAGFDFAEVTSVFVGFASFLLSFVVAKRV